MAAGLAAGCLATGFCAVPGFAALELDEFERFVVTMVELDNLDAETPGGFRVTEGFEAFSLMTDAFAAFAVLAFAPGFTVVFDDVNGLAVALAADLTAAFAAGFADELVAAGLAAALAVVFAAGLDDAFAAGFAAGLDDALVVAGLAAALAVVFAAGFNNPYSLSVHCYFPQPHIIIKYRYPSIL